MLLSLNRTIRHIACTSFGRDAQRALFITAFGGGGLRGDPGLKGPPLSDLILKNASLSPKEQHARAPARSVFIGGQQQIRLRLRNAFEQTDARDDAIELLQVLRAQLRDEVPTTVRRVKRSHRWIAA